ncbi:MULTISPECIES: mechanosensitive ion channel family protein [unclassified Flavobacterium]|uniref:mechanosensitive ion channel family protein n=1 Tax=unclassified Flavobacterium TaxID=196869 RepID=UPI00131E7DB9|nr:MULTISPECIES: mechanosensitive ion channel domain-containing protein [unclassified Flavobacterium]
MNDFLKYNIIKYGDYSLPLANIIIILALFISIYIFLTRIKSKILNNKKIDELEQGRRLSIYLLVKYLIYIFGIISSIKIAGFDISILVTGSAALLVGIGFGLQGLFYDIISGIIILFERKIRVGDILELKDKVGKVKSISLRTSVLLTRDEEEIIVPNHFFIKDEIINTSYASFFRRFRIEIVVDHNADVQLIQEILINAALKQKDIIKAEEAFPKVRLSDIDTIGLHFELLYYTNEVFRIGFLKSDLRYEILKQFNANNIKFATANLEIFDNNKKTT